MCNDTDPNVVYNITHEHPVQTLVKVAGVIAITAATTIVLAKVTSLVVNKWSELQLKKLKREHEELIKKYEEGKKI